MATVTPIRNVSKNITPASGNLVLLDDGVSMGKATLSDAVAAVANGLIDAAIDDLDLGTASTQDIEDFATAAQGAKADNAIPSSAIGTTVQPYSTRLKSLADAVDGTTGQVVGRASDGSLQFQNAGAGDMLAANNGSDFANKATTVVNIGALPSFSTKAEAEAFAPASPVDHIRTAGYSSAGDGGGALYKKVESEPSHAGKLSITLNDGTTVVWYEIADRFRTFEMYGAVGDDDNAAGGADDTDALNAALATGLPVYGGGASKIYRVTDRLDMAPRTLLNLLGARINFYTDESYGLMPNNFCEVTNGKIVHFGDAAVSGDKQAPISVGTYVSAETYHDIRISNMELEAKYSYSINVTGGSYNVIAENITIIANATSIGGLQVHWGGDTGGTFHPHDVVFRNIRMNGNYSAVSASASTGIWLSGCYNVTLENIYIDQVGTVLRQYCGDYGTQYALTQAIANMVCKGINISNVACKSALAGASFDGKPYISGSVVPMAVVVDNFIARCSDTTASAAKGVFFQNARGVEVRGGSLELFNSGVGVGGDQVSRNCRVAGMSIRNSYTYGVNFGLTTAPCEDMVLEDCYVENNNVSEDATFIGSGIIVGGSKRSKIRGNTVSGFRHQNGVYSTSGAVDAIVENNYVALLAGGGVAYNMGAATRGSGNRAASGITLHSGSIITDCLVGTATVNLAELAAGARISQSVTVTGAALGDFVEAISATVWDAALSVTGAVETTNTVRLWVMNMNSGSAVDSASTTFTVLVRKRA